MLHSTPSDYFQQTVDHEIDVALDDAEHILRGDIATRYTNNSGDTLEFIWIHLWPNAYKNGQTALAQQKFRQGEMKDAIQDYLRHTNASLRAAVEEYCQDKAATEREWGKIGTWDVGRVTDMSKLFENRTDFDEDITAWDT